MLRVNKRKMPTCRYFWQNQSSVWIQWPNCRHVIGHQTVDLSTRKRPADFVIGGAARVLIMRLPAAFGGARRRPKRTKGDKEPDEGKKACEFSITLENIL